MNESKINILITGGGAPGAAGIIACLREIKNIHIVAGDRNPEAHGKYLADSFVTLPDAEDPNFIESVKLVCKQKNIQLILPLVTRELEPFSSAIKEFKEMQVAVLVSNPKSLKLANDKGLLYKTLLDAYISAPDFRRVSDWFGMHKAIQDLGYPHKPVVIKPCKSNGLRGFRIVQPNIDELDLLLNHKPDSRYISLQKLQDIFSRNPMPDYVVSEYLPGEEYTVDVLAQKGKVLQVIPRLRSAMTGGISTRGEMINHTEIIDYVTKIVSLLELDWLIGVQVKKASDGSFKILEINPRVQGTTVACIGAGINFPKLAVELSLHNTFTYQQPKWGTKFFRHWKEVYY